MWDLPDWSLPSHSLCLHLCQSLPHLPTMFCWLCHRPTVSTPSWCHWHKDVAKIASLLFCPWFKEQRLQDKDLQGNSLTSIRAVCKQGPPISPSSQYTIPQQNTFARTSVLKHVGDWKTSGNNALQLSLIIVQSFNTPWIWGDLVFWFSE